MGYIICYRPCTVYISLALDYPMLSVLLLFIQKTLHHKLVVHSGHSVLWKGGRIYLCCTVGLLFGLVIGRCRRSQVVVTAICKRYNHKQTPDFFFKKKKKQTNKKETYLWNTKLHWWQQNLQTPPRRSLIHEYISIMIIKKIGKTYSLKPASQEWLQASRKVQSQTSSTVQQIRWSHIPIFPSWTEHPAYLYVHWRHRSPPA